LLQIKASHVISKLDTAFCCLSRLKRAWLEFEGLVIDNHYLFTEEISTMFKKLFSRDEAKHEEDKPEKGKDTNHSDSPKFAPNTKISYKPELIPNLQKEHQNLLDLYDRASKAAHAKIPKQAKKFLAQFKDIFVHHVLLENTSLYIYLQRSAQNETSEKSMKAIKSEMEKISRDVMKFLNHAIKESTPIDADYLQQIDEIAEILHHRITQEEGDIYPDYLTLGAQENIRQKSTS
jgi:hypothetical protein